MNESANPIIKYFSEFKILKTVSKDFWLTNVVQFFDGMAYFSLITHRRCQSSVSPVVLPAV